MRTVQVDLRDDQVSALRSLAARTGGRRSDLLRQGVDLVIAETQRGEGDWRAATRAGAGIWRDRDGLNEVLRASRGIE